MKDSYDDIINFPHHVSPRHPKMPLSDRAAQFAPFAALTGYDDAVEETARYIDKQFEISEDGMAEIDFKLRGLSEHEKENPPVCTTYFLHDDRKNGGKYVTKQGRLKKTDILGKSITLTDGTKISFADIVGIESDILNK